METTLSHTQPICSYLSKSWMSVNGLEGAEKHILRIVYSGRFICFVVLMEIKKGKKRVFPSREVWKCRIEITLLYVAHFPYILEICSLFSTCSMYSLCMLSSDVPFSLDACNSSLSNRYLRFQIHVSIRLFKIQSLDVRRYYSSPVSGKIFPTFCRKQDIRPTSR